MEFFQIPFTDPVAVFAVVLLVILISPILFSKIKIPGIVGLILSGVLLGPHGFHVLERDTSIVLFGTVGLLYIMFMAGLEMDMNEFRINKHKSFVFGALTFLLPFILGFVVSRYLLHYNILASVLLASMFSTHTLIAYPIVGRLGITQSRTMAVIIGGTIITDATVLMILAVIANIQEHELSPAFFVRLFGLLAAMVFVILWGVPRLGRWFFRNLESEGYSQYIFVLCVVFLCGFLAHAIGIEPIIGAFLAGLALNQLIPNTSTLMNRIDFVGNSIFIPFFLISVGMLVDFRVLLQGYEALLLAFLIISVSFTGKWLASYFTQKIFGYTKPERDLIWGMSSAHAAATIAVVLIGYNLALLDENVLNGTILLILVSCLGSSMITEKAGRKIAIDEEQKIAGIAEHDERILVPVANLANVDRLIDLSLMIKRPQLTEPIYPLYVVQNKNQAMEAMAQYQQKIHHALKDSAIETRKEPVFRVDVNVANGILRAVAELRITDIVIGWNGKVTYSKRLGPILDSVVDNTKVQVMICKLLQPVNTIKRILAVVPENAEKERGFNRWVETVFQLAGFAGADLEMFTSSGTLAFLNKSSGEKPRQVNFSQLETRNDLFSLKEKIHADDLLLIVLGRRQTVSHHATMERVPASLSRFFKETSVIMLYPSQP